MRVRRGPGVGSAARFGLAIAPVGYGALLAEVAGLSAPAGIGSGLWAGLAGATLLPAGPFAVARDRATMVLAGGSIVFLLLVLAASHAGTTDSRRLQRLALTDAAGHEHPAATILWTPPGTTAVQTTIGRLIGLLDWMLLVYDLLTCTLRRLTGDVSVSSRLIGSTLGLEPDNGRGSVLPCPRDG